MNGLPTGFVKFVNQTQMASFGSLVGEVRWTIVTMVLTAVAAWLLTRPSETMRATGLAVAGMVTTTLVGKTIASVVSNKNVRETSREYIEAKERGKAIGEAITAERPALHAEHIDKVEMRTEAVPAGLLADEEHRWRDRDPTQGLG